MAEPAIYAGSGLTHAEIALPHGSQSPPRGRLASANATAGRPLNTDDPWQAFLKRAKHQDRTRTRSRLAKGMEIRCDSVELRRVQVGMSAVTEQLVEDVTVHGQQLAIALVQVLALSHQLAELLPGLLQLHAASSGVLAE